MSGLWPTTPILPMSPMALLWWRRCATPSLAKRCETTTGRVGVPWQSQLMGGVSTVGDDRSAPRIFDGTALSRRLARRGCSSARRSARSAHQPAVVARTCERAALVAHFQLSGAASEHREDSQDPVPGKRRCDGANKPRRSGRAGSWLSDATFACLCLFGCLFLCGRFVCCESGAAMTSGKRP